MSDALGRGEMHDGPLSWHIPSDTNSDDAYLVELGANGEIGECSCKHFVCRCGPSIKKGKPMRCKHIISARELFTDWAIHEIASRDKNNEP